METGKNQYDLPSSIDKDELAAYHSNLVNQIDVMPERYDITEEEMIEIGETLDDITSGYFSYGELVRTVKTYDGAENSSIRFAALRGLVEGGSINMEEPLHPAKTISSGYIEYALEDDVTELDGIDGMSIGSTVGIE